MARRSQMAMMRTSRKTSTVAKQEAITTSMPTMKTADMSSMKLGAEAPWLAVALWAACRAAVTSVRHSLTVLCLDSYEMDLVPVSQLPTLVVTLEANSLALFQAPGGASLTHAAIRTFSSLVMLSK